MKYSCLVSILIFPDVAFNTRELNHFVAFNDRNAKIVRNFFSHDRKRNICDKNRLYMFR